MWVAGCKTLLTLYGGVVVGVGAKTYSRYMRGCNVGRGSVVCERRTLLVKTFPKLPKLLKLPTHAIWGVVVGVGAKTYSRYMGQGTYGRVARKTLSVENFP